jgi:hypothetical protein
VPSGVTVTEQGCARALASRWAGGRGVALYHSVCDGWLVPSVAPCGFRDEMFTECIERLLRGRVLFGCLFMSPMQLTVGHWQMEEKKCVPLTHLTSENNQQHIHFTLIDLHFFPAQTSSVVWKQRRIEEAFGICDLSTFRKLPRKFQHIVDACIRFARFFCTIRS